LKPIAIVVLELAVFDSMLYCIVLSAAIDVNTDRTDFAALFNGITCTAKKYLGIGYGCMNTCA
jgi:hypothetical protein